MVRAMPFLSHGSYRIRYELEGPADAPTYVLVNGLTQYAELWAACRDALLARGFRVLAGCWQGNKAVWIAPEDAGGGLAPFPAGYDHLRAIPAQGRDYSHE